MLNNLLDIVNNKNGKFDGNFYFENFGEACIYALIGFLIVVIGIVLIICIIWLTGLLIRKTDNLAFLRNFSFKKKNKKVKEISDEKPSVVDEEEIPDEIKAAIIAAIMAYYTAEQPKCEFKVKRIKRI